MTTPSESADRAKTLQEIERAIALNTEDATEGDLGTFASVVSDWIMLHWDDPAAKSLTFHIDLMWGGVDRGA